MSLHDFFTGGKVQREALAEHLDQLDPGARVQAARSLTARQQALLFDAAKGFRPLRLEHFVPQTVHPLHQVIHYGRNSLPVFRIFEKRFCRPAGSDGEAELWGYNEQSLKPLTGPGYFVVRQADEDEVVIDYCRTPPGKPDAWPRILPNSARLSRFIYNGTQDFMRGVSRHVAIGRATRAGKPMNNWFVLCREDR